MKGQQVTPDEVVKDFRAVKATLDLARFKAECCLKGLFLTPDGKLKPEQVTPDAVVKDYPGSPEGKLGIARFKQECCLRGLPLNGQQVTPDAVVNGFPDNPEGKLGIARFKQECCLRGLPLNGQQVTPDAVVNGFPDNPEGKLGIARFKEECCLRDLPLNGQQVTPAVVVKDYQAVKATLELARFKAECCLKGLLLSPDGKQKPEQVTPDAVVKDYPGSPEGKLGIARFKQECCLRDLPLNGQQVTPDAVVNGFPDNPEGKLGIARFKQECCLRDLPLNGQQVTPDAVVNGFPDNPEGKLGIVRFKQECCLRGLPLNGRQVTPDAVVNGFPDNPEGKLGIVRFKQECCLRGLPLNGRQVTPDAVVKGYECNGWLLERAIFYSQLALNARELNDCHLDNETVLKAFDEVPGDHSSRQVEYLMQRLKKTQLYDETNEAQGTLQQAWQILNNVSVKNDEQHRLQCILKFMAVQYELPLDHQRVSAEQVLQTIKTLRSSFQNSRLEFFFLAHCFKTRLSIGGQKIHESQVLNCLQSFPEGSKLRHALRCWFERFSSEDYLMEQLLYKRDTSITKRDSDSRHGHAASASQGDASMAVNREHFVLPKPGSDNTNASFLPSDGENSYSAKRVNSATPDHRDFLDVIPVIERSGGRKKSVEVSVANFNKGGLFPCRVPGYRGGTKIAENTFVTQTVSASATQTLKQLLNVGGASLPDNQVARLNVLTLKALEIIQEVNSFFTEPPILITGSFSRFLQNRCSSFKDIDIICMTEESARILFEKLQILNAEKWSEVPRSIVIWPIPGCSEIRLPRAYNIALNEGDLGTQAMGLQVSVEARVTYWNRKPLLVHVPGVERPVCCLSFAEEIKSLNDTLKHLGDQLVPLTEQLQKGDVFDIPRTILFNLPKTINEQIYGLLMRSLLSLNKGKQFISLYSEEKYNQLPEQQDLHTLTKNLQMKLKNHDHLNGFLASVNYWLSKAPCVSDYEINKKTFIKGIIANMYPE
ncbi:hypothetical protein [uncultured Endozoicomonas sp.]|uniref:hypothetical protein n=1 Tax=uncultured Endozoicomonas sp. TaxID=432652 RepID=UPI00262C852F|nr:hypothetical protein [uncultured Endozoicomonas sp.]